MSKIILITGATKGIGLATSIMLNSKGYQVIGIARNAPEESFPGKLFLCDLSDPKKTEDTLHKISKETSIYGVINNAGITHPQYLGEIDLQTLQVVLDFNIRTTVQVTQHFLVNMKENREGRIINLSSRAIIGMEKLTSYSIAKAGIIGATRTWAKELASFNITVNAVAPGPTDTELLRKTKKPGTPEGKKLLDTLPFKRLAKPEEIAAAISFLCSDEASYISGQTLHVDGASSI